MKLLEATAIYFTIAKTFKFINECRGEAPFFTSKIAEIQHPLVKTAFDTRRINQEIEYNPRRGLQYYHRSEGFIKKNTSAMVNTFAKLKGVMDELKDQYLGSPEWLDSHCRVLNAALDRILRVAQNDQEFFEPQLNYLEELMNVRYRLTLNDIEVMDPKQLKVALLSKDEPLSNAVLINNDYKTGNSKTNTTQISGVDQLVKELLSNVKASAENNEVERSITISIKDKIIK